MIDGCGHVKLIDFGLAVRIKNDVEPMSPTGSLIYMAPEMLRDLSGGRHTDWWALGVLAHELMTGRTPWSSLTNKAVIRKEIETMNISPPMHISPPAGKFICSLLKHNFSTRLGTKSDSEVRAASFFATIDWEAAERQVTRPALLVEAPDATSEREMQAALKEYLSRSQTSSLTSCNWSLGVDSVGFHPDMTPCLNSPEDDLEADNFF